MSTRRATATVLGLALAAWACGRSPQEVGRGRGVLVIAIDGLRADHLGLYGYDRDTSPNLERLARQGVSFTQAYSTAPWALPAHISLLTGCDPNVARRLLPESVPETVLTVWHVPDSLPRLAGELLRSGYRTAAFFADPALSPVHGLEGGFESYTITREGRPPPTRAVHVAGDFVRWLRGLPPQQDWFAYLELESLDDVWLQQDPQWDTHFEPRPELDYVPPVSQIDHVYFAIPRRNWSGGLRSLGEYEARYDGAIRRIDEALGRLFKQLIRERRMATTTIVVCGTHGMDFGESGLILDHGTLSEADLHVPLLVRPADSLPAVRGQKSDALASLVDVAPTLLELCGLPIPGTMQGVSLAAVVRGEPRRPRRYAFASCGRQEGYAAMTDRYTLEARMPGLAGHRGLMASWFGDGVPHEGAYCEAFYDRSHESGGLCRSGRSQDPVAAELRAVSRAAFERSHALRTELQSAGWGIGAEEVRFEPTLLLWAPRSP